jgi:hypothetical protein
VEGGRGEGQRWKEKEKEKETGKKITALQITFHLSSVGSLS